MDNQDYLKALQDRASSVLKHRLEAPGMASQLEEAVHYVVHNGGKRIRPVLAYASAEAVGGTQEDADNCACAVELIHAYSLVHDDLPAMDDDALRRGQPTCHIKFDEATAILAGDALQSLAYELLTDTRGRMPEPSKALEMISTLAAASGWKGMVGGQSLDIEGAGKIKNEQELALMHQLKTGALINASVRLGALSTGLVSDIQLQSLETFSSCMGLAFQIRDDILDVEGDTQTLGKQQGKDLTMNKPTYPSILGMDGAKQRMQSLLEEGTVALEGFGDKGSNLLGIAHYIIDRQH
ncbi:MAG: polyprenyl synthetase family protein [Gammaproteobacteria bacterium]|nr:polyprenyl synthetase family protein [Gammaproteobacteria bacterium]